MSSSKESSKTAAEKPWLTKGILNACKKKKILYKDFLKKRTKEMEQILDI